MSGREAARIRAADGALVRALPIPEFEGDIMGVDCCGSFAFAATGTRVTVWPLD